MDKETETQRGFLSTSICTHTVYHQGGYQKPVVCGSYFSCLFKNISPPYFPLFSVSSFALLDYSCQHTNI